MQCYFKPFQRLAQQYRRMFDERCRWCHTSIHARGARYLSQPSLHAPANLEKTNSPLPAILQSLWQAMYHEGVLCSSCLKTLSWSYLQTSCQKCALPINHTGDLCGFCQNNDLDSLDKVHAAFVYEEPIKSLMLQFKHFPDSGLCRYFVQALLQSMLLPSSPWHKLYSNPLEYETYDALLPVPLHPKRMRERGYQQSWLLTKMFSKQIKKKLPNLKLLKTTDCWIQKVRDRGSQKNQQRHERFRSVKGCFAISEPASSMVRGGRFLLLDDVMTSGATLNTVAQVLKKHGAQSVNALVVARATLGSNTHLKNSRII